MGNERIHAQLVPGVHKVS